MYIVETRIKTRGNKTIWMPYKQYRTTNGIENFQKRHQYLFDAGGLRVTGNAEPRRSHIKSGEGMLRVGDILHESYGYGMTINKFYEVIALSPSGKTCTIQPIRKITIKGDAYSLYGSEVVPQTEGEDYSIESGIVVFSRQLLKEELGFGRWLAMFLGLFGTYRVDETIDIEYARDGRRLLSSDLKILPD